MAFQAFIKTESSVSGVMAGESKDGLHADFSDVVSLSFGADRKITGALTSGAAYLGPASFDVVQVDMKMDKSLPLYMQAIAESHVITAELDVIESTGKDPFMKISLANGRICSVEVVGDATGDDARPMARVRISYEEITYQVTAFVDGEPDAAAEFVWMVAAGEAG